MKKDEEVRSKKELEAELLKVRSEIQWREREKEELDESSHPRKAISFMIVLTLLPILYLFGEGLGIVIWIIVAIILITISEKSFKKTREGKKLQKAKRELKELRKRKTELEKKLDNLESLEKSKEHSN